MTYKNPQEQIHAERGRINDMLRRLTAFSAHGMDIDAATANWGHASFMADLAASLKEVTDRAFCEGEYRDDRYFTYDDQGHRVSSISPRQ